MTTLFDKHGVRTFRPSRREMVAVQSKTIAEQLRLRKISLDTAVRHYGRCLDIMSDQLAQTHPRFRQLVDDTDNLPDEVEFREIFHSLLAQLSNEPLLAPLTHNIGFPFIIPRMTIRHYGRSLLGLFLPLLEASITQYFSMQDKPYKLTVPSEPPLRAWQKDSRFTFIQASRYAQLIEALAKHYILAIFFPALPGFSFSAAIQQMDGLPSSLVLSGAATTAMAIATWPEHLHKLHLMCPAIRYEHDDCSVCFEPQNGATVFEPTHPNLYANGLARVNSGLIYIGNQC